MTIETTTSYGLADFRLLAGDDATISPVSDEIVGWDGEVPEPSTRRPTEAFDTADLTDDAVLGKLEAEAAEARRKAELAAVRSELADEYDADAQVDAGPIVWGPHDIGRAFARMRKARRKAGLPTRPGRDEGTAPATPSTPATGGTGKGKAKAKARRRPAKRQGQGQRTDGQMAAKRSAATERVTTLRAEGWSLAAHHVGPRVETWLLARDGKRTKVEAPVAPKAKARRGRRPARRR